MVGYADTQRATVKIGGAGLSASASPECLGARVTPAILYARKSVEKRDRYSPSIESQLKACREAAKLNRLSIVGEFSDRGISGARSDRPGLKKAIAACPRGGVLVTWSTDRFSRSIKHAFTFLEDELDPKQVSLLCPGDGVDTRTEAGRTQFAYMAVGAEMERRRVAVRVRRWYGDRLQAGYQHGKPPYGYDKTDKGDLRPNRATAPVVKFIFKLAAQGHGASRIASVLEERGIEAPVRGGRWRIEVLREMLTRPAYIGFVGRRKQVENPRVWQEKWELFDARHKPLVDRETWERVQAHILARSGRRSQSPNGYPFLLTGILRCAHCGGRMGGSYQYRNSQRRYARYTCERRKRKIGCEKGQTLGATQLERMFLNGIESVLRQQLPDYRIVYRTAIEGEEREALEGQLRALEQREANLLRMIEEAENLEKDLIKRVGERYAEIKAERAEIEKQIKQTHKASPTIHLFRGLPQAMRSPKVPIEQKRERLRAVFSAVTWDPKEGLTLILRDSGLC